MTFVSLVAAPAASALFGCGLSITCIIDKGVGGGISAIAGDAIQALAQSVLQALNSAVEWTATLWMGIGMPQLANSSGQPVGSVFDVQQYLGYVTAGLAVFSVLVGAGKVAWEENKGYHARAVYLSL